MLVADMSDPMMSENIWFDKTKYDEAESQFYEEEVQRKKKSDVGSRKSNDSPDILDNAGGGHVSDVGDVEHGNGNGNESSVSSDDSVLCFVDEDDVLFALCLPVERNVTPNAGALPNVPFIAQLNVPFIAEPALHDINHEHVSHEIFSTDRGDGDNIFVGAQFNFDVGDNADDDNNDVVQFAGSLAEEIANARKRLQTSLQSGDQPNFDPIVAFQEESLFARLQKIEEANADIRRSMQDVQTRCNNLEQQFQELVERMEDSCATYDNRCHVNTPQADSPPQRDDSRQQVIDSKVIDSQSANHEAACHVNTDGDDDIDLFGSEEDDEAAAKLREERLKKYEEKKSKKTAVVAKSSVIFDIKPWDDETDMKAMEDRVRNIIVDGLTWGASKLVPLAFGIKKLQIVSTVEDEKVSVDWLQEEIPERIEDLVQSVDIAAFNKL